MFGGLVGGLVKGAIGLVGGALGRREERRATQDARDYDAKLQHDYFVKLRENSERGGINVLTALGNGGYQGAAGGTPVAPKLASLDMMMGSLKNISDEFTGVASQQRARDQLELDLAKIELDKAKAAASAVITPAPNRMRGGPSLGRNAQKAGPITVNRETEREGTSVFGVDIQPMLGTSNAEDFEKRYGDIASSAAGIVTGVGDIAKTFWKWKGNNAVRSRNRIQRNRQTQMQILNEKADLLGM